MSKTPTILSTSKTTPSTKRLAAFGQMTPNQPSRSLELDLSLQFPIAQGYVTRPQDEHTSQSGERGFSDLHTFQYRGTSNTADKFLIVQCKRAEYEGWSSVWAEGVHQLDRYLSATHGTRRPQHRTPVFGILAVGKYMRVYKYDDVNRCVLNWAPRGLRRGETWHLNDHASAVQRILDHILNNH